MRIALFSDVHANLEALDTVLREMTNAGVERRYCLGDLVGYGGSPEECVQRVKAIVDGAVLGNDDAALIGTFDYSFYYENARKALDIHTRLMSGDSTAWLRSLPYTLELKDLGIRLCHGSPGHPENFEYVFMKEQARHCLSIYDDLPPVTFMGHTHLFKIFELSPGRAEEIPTQDGVPPLLEDRKYLVTVGSVGQPRDHNNHAGFAIYDTVTRQLEFKRAGYHIDKAATSILDIGIDRDLANRLYVAI